MEYVAIALALVVVVAAAYFLLPYLATGSRLSPHTCLPGPEVMHIHPRLSIFVQGSRIPIPYNVGIVGTCTKLLHTHDQATGPEGYVPDTDPAVIHVESHIRQDFFLSDFFSVWGRDISPTQILGYSNDGANVWTMSVDGSPSSAFGDLVLRDEQLTTLSYGPIA